MLFYNKESKNRAIIALCINLFVISFLWLVIGIVYETNDDPAMMSLICHNKFYSFGFINYFLAYFIGLLQSIFPIINMYSVFSVLLIFSSLTALTYKVLKGENLLVKSFIVTGVVLLFGYLTYCQMNFTRTSVIAFIAGTVFLISCFNNKISIKNLIAGMIFVITGSMLRFSNTYIFWAFILTFVAVLILHKLLIKKGVIPILKRTVMLITIISAVLISLQGISLRINSSNEYYQDYSLSRKYKCEILDHGIPEYNTHSEEYANLGISNLDYEMAKSWNHDDNGELDIPKLEKIVEVKEKVTKTGVQALIYKFDDFFTYFSKLILPTNINTISILFYCFIAIMIFAIYISGLKSLLFSVPLGGLSIALQCFLYVFKKVPYRALFGIWAFAIIILYFSLQFLPQRSRASNIIHIINSVFSKKRVNILIKSIAIVLLCTSFFGCLFMQVKSYSSDEYGVPNTIEREFIENQDKLYVASTLDDFLGKDVYPRYGYILSRSLYEPKYDNFVRLGGWSTGLPPNLNILKRFNVNNIYRDMIDNPNIVFVADVNKASDYFSLVQRYMDAYYTPNGKTLVWNVQKSIDNVTLYSVTTEPIT